MQELFNCVMDIGEQMLLCGAEVHRVEDSIQRMCSAIGVDRVDIFIITSSMVATIQVGDKTYTQTKRITNVGTDIERLHHLNELSRYICHNTPNAEDIREKFNAILNQKNYPFWLECLSYIAIAGSFTLFFGGNFVEALVSLVIGGVIRFVVLFADKSEMNRIFGKFICAFIASALAFAALKLGIIEKVDKVMIGNIMILIPGVGLTNALRDLLVGDSVSGLLRFIEATLAALAIAAGYFLFAFISGGIAL